MVKSSSQAETIELGRRLAGFLRRGDVVGLVGELGVGKTTLIKGIASGLGVKRPVRSPSFIVITQYMGEIPVYHIDLYRIETPSQLREFDVLEYLYTDGIALVEWAEKIWNLLPPHTIKITLRSKGAEERIIEIHSERFKGL